MSKRRRSRGKHLSQQANIESLTLEGKGVAHIDGKAVFITGALPGEQVIYQTTRSKARFDEGYMLEVLKSSPERVEPRCPHYAFCGACSWQHMALDKQIIHKQNALLDNLKHIAQLTPQHILEPLIAEGWGYRRKARLGVRWVRKKGKALVGFRERNGRFLTEMDSCEILHPKVGKHLHDLQHLISNLQAREHIPQIEVSVGDQGCALIFRHMEPLSVSDTQQLIDFAKHFEFQLYLQPAGPESIHCLWPESPVLYYQHPDSQVRIDFKPLDFIQINQPLNCLMVNKALQLLEPASSDSVLDLFCGLGNFTLPLAKQVAKVTAVEGDLAMVERAQQIAQDNQINHTQYYACNLMDQDQLAKEPWLTQSYDKLLLDPPRAGAQEVIAHMDKLNPKRIVYISCHPGTLARDAAQLVHQQGYQLRQAGVMDMFPHTSHVESITVFERASKIKT